MTVSQETGAVGSDAQVEPTVPTHTSDLAEVPNRWSASWASVRTVAILIVLGFIGWYGHRSHWTISLSHHEDAAHRAEPESSTANADLAPSGVRQLESGEIEFPSVDAIKLVGLTTTEVVRKPITEEVPAHGIVDFDRKLVTRISSRVDGTVWRVEKHLGDIVRKGDILAIIESVKIGDAKAEFLSSLAVLESRREQRERLQELTDVVSLRAYREALLSEREAVVRLRNAEQTLINFGLPLQYRDYLPLDDQERFQRLHFLGLPESLTADWDPARTTSNLAPLIAPFDGQVISRDVSMGEVVQTDDILFELADNSRMWLLLDVYKEDAGRLAIGQPLRFTADGADRPIDARIDWISTEVDEQTRTVQVRAQVDNPVVSRAPNGAEQRLLRANTFGTARICVREHAEAAVVPRECLQWDHDGYVVFVQTSERRFRMVRVERGIAHDGEVEIVGEVKPGAMVVRYGSHLLKSKTLLDRLANAAP